MQICTRSLANVKPHMRRKAHAVIREFFRRNRQDYRRGPAFDRTNRNFRSRMPSTYVLPLVGVEAIHEQGSRMAPPVYLSTYSNRIENPATCVLDRI
ncbi:hypothetical protein [Streptomyces ardesiacus]|uniref:hypothetical protein n=1 Tax=Streptomyces ardesiacus TaxID=285564 RepID=UPI003827CC7D